jgi:ketosteroid isomerase-like protein
MTMQNGHGDAQAAEVVAAYAQAKSHADVAEALRHCTNDLVVHTIPFQTVVAGKTANRASFGAFFGVFPDYAVELEATAGAGDLLSGWGTLRASMQGPIGRVRATQRRFELPFACVWTVTGGLLAHERFFFDLHQMCEQLGLDTTLVIEEIRAAARLLSPEPEAAAHAGGAS